MLAGLGTGKTTLLTDRVLYVINSTPDERSKILALTFTNRAAAEMRSVINSTPDERSKILALTFTNRAAAEMRSRLRLHGDHFDSRLFIGTFHGFATQVLRSHGDAIGLDTDFVIFDQADQRAVLEELRDDGELGVGVNIDSVITAFSRLKSRGVSLSHPQPDGQSNAFESLGLIHDKYRTRLTRSNALDFGDLIMECLRLFSEKPGFRDLYRIAYPYVLVDEFQDTTPAQFELLRELVDGGERSHG